MRGSRSFREITVQKAPRLTSGREFGTGVHGRGWNFGPLGKRRYLARARQPKTAGARTAGPQPRPPAGPAMDPFLVLLHSVSSSLSSSELTELKFLCLGRVSKRKLERVQSGLDLFSVLLEQNDLEPGHTDLLRELLASLRRHDLLRRLDDFEAGVAAGAAPGEEGGLRVGPREPGPGRPGVGAARLLPLASRRFPFAGFDLRGFSPFSPCFADGRAKNAEKFTYSRLQGLVAPSSFSSTPFCPGKLENSLKKR